MKKKAEQHGELAPRVAVKLHAQMSGINRPRKNDSKTTRGPSKTPQSPSFP